MFAKTSGSVFQFSFFNSQLICIFAADYTIWIMSQKTFWKIQFINLCIDVFARKFRLAPQVAYNYLSKYKGLEFLNDNYESEHTQSLQDTQNTLRIICHRNGGSI